MKKEMNEEKSCGKNRGPVTRRVWGGRRGAALWTALFACGVLAGGGAAAQQPTTSTTKTTSHPKATSSLRATNTAAKAPATKATTGGTPAPAAQDLRTRLGIPKDAKQINDTQYRWLDAHGEAWIYTVGPFGAAKRKEIMPEGEGNAPAPDSAASANAKARLGVPEGAKQISDTQYRWLDAQGVAWIYTVGPFGASKHKEGEKVVEPPPAGPPPQNPLKAFPEGDTVRFELSTPFGTRKYSKKRTDLNDGERKALAEAEDSAVSTGRN